ncbi:MAG: hypothetical protein F6K32_01645 [Desertifilum sp. SIO1I2]|nr:hypothetical protein [Desertifilum sp. SIO1I2]
MSIIQLMTLQAMPNLTGQPITEIWEKTKTTGKEAVGSLSQGTSEALGQSKALLDKGSTQVTQAAENLAQSTSEALGQGKVLIEQTMSQVNSLINQVYIGTQIAVQEAITNWLNAHPIIHWLVNHPLLSLFLILLSIVLIISLIQALIGLIKKAWIAIFTSPTKLIQSVVTLIYKSISWAIQFVWLNFKPTSQKALVASPSVTDIKMIIVPEDLAIDDSSKLNEILQKIESLQQEQSKLLQEIFTLSQQKH